MKMLVLINEEQRKWLEKKNKETEIKFSGIIRSLINKEMKREMEMEQLEKENN